MSGIESVVDAIQRLLHPQGYAFVEIGAGQSEAAQQLVAQRGLKVVEIRADIGGILRVLALIR